MNKSIGEIENRQTPENTLNREELKALLELFFRAGEQHERVEGWSPAHPPDFETFFNQTFPVIN